MPVIKYENFEVNYFPRHIAPLLRQYYDMSIDKVSDDKKDAFTKFGEYLENLEGLLSANNEENRKNYLAAMDGFRDFLYEKDDNGITNYQKLKEGIFMPVQVPFLQHIQTMSYNLQLGVNFEELDRLVVEKDDSLDDIIDLNQAEDGIKADNKNAKELNPEQLEVAVDYIRNLRDNAFTYFNPRKIPFAQKDEYMEDFKENVLRIMAARMIANSDRGKADKLRTTTFSKNEIDELVNKMKNDTTFRDFLQEITKDPDQYMKAFLAATRNPGHGGGLDDMFKEFMLNRGPGFMPNDKLHERYLPTVKERIESIQKWTANHNSLVRQQEEVRAKLDRMQQNGGDSDEITELMGKFDILTTRLQNYIKGYEVGEIIALRNLAKADYGKKESLNKKIPAFEENTLNESSSYFCEDYPAVFAICRSEESQRLLQEGHGGKMVKYIRDTVNAIKDQEIDEPIKEAVNQNTIDTYIKEVKDKAGDKAEEISDAIEAENAEDAAQAAKEGKIIINEYLLLIKETWNKNLNTTDAALFDKDVPWTKIDELNKQGESYDKDLMNSLKKFKPADIQNCLEFIKNNDPAGFVRHLNEKMVEVGNRKPAANPHMEDPQANLGGHGMHP